MMKSNRGLASVKDNPKWITIKEAISIANNINDIYLTEGDIYRYALHGDITLSIYFQSPPILRKIQTSNYKVKLRPVSNSLLHQLCTLEKNSFIHKKELIVSTGGNYISPTQRIIDTELIGYEYVLIQCLLAISLGIVPPQLDERYTNYGITVTLYGEPFQVFERASWHERTKRQLLQLPESLALNIAEKIAELQTNMYCHKEYFPLYDLPRDACFVIRYTELEKLFSAPLKSPPHQPTSTRISTPLSRLFWLACKNNAAIGPLVKQPYKLLTIFEQWAAAEGITDKLSGDTLKTALERGSPALIKNPPPL